MLSSSLWGRKWSFFLPHRDRPPRYHNEPCGAGNDHFFCPTGPAAQDITTSIKHCNLQCFLFLPRAKQRYLRCFIFREPQNRVKTVSQQPKTQVQPKHRYLRHFGNTTCPKCCILQCFWSTVSKTLVFTVFCENTCRGLGEIREGPSQGNLGGGWHFPWRSQRTEAEELVPHRTDHESLFLFPSCHKCLVAGASREVPCVHRGFEPFVFEVFTTTREWGAGQAARTSWIFAVDPATKTHAEFFIQQFGEDFPRLCNEEAVSPDSESLQVLKNTLVCDSSKVENDAVGEEEATQKASEAAMQYAARRVEARGFPATDLAACEASGSSGTQHVKRARLDWIHRACDTCRIRRKRAGSVARIFGTKQHMSLMCALMRYHSLGHVRFSVGTRALVGFLRRRCSTTNEKGACALVPAPQNHHSLAKDTTAKQKQFYAKRLETSATCLQHHIIQSQN